MRAYRKVAVSNAPAGVGVSSAVGVHETGDDLLAEFSKQDVHLTRLFVQSGRYVGFSVSVHPLPPCRTIELVLFGNIRGWVVRK